MANDCPFPVKLKEAKMASKYDEMSYLDLINAADAKGITIRKDGEILDADAIRELLKKK